MSKIGSWGNDLIFKVSESQVRTFSDFKRTVTARWTSHQSVYGKPGREFQGADLDQITLSVTLCAGLGVKPRKVIEKLEKAVLSGKSNYLVIGGKKVGNHKYNITKMSENWEEILAKGKLFEAKISLTFYEYH